MIIVVTGHRPKKIGDIYDLYHPLYKSIGWEMRNFLLERILDLKEGEILTGVSGMALGIDTLFALIILRLKREYPGKIKLNCIIPCKGHSNRWNKDAKRRYNDILKQADEVIYTSNAKYVNYSTMYKRDEYMVDLLDKEDGYVISVWNGFKSGGTYHTISYAEERHKKIFNINPLNYKPLIEGA